MKGAKRSLDVYLALLAELHLLFQQGRGDSEEADLVRDQMDGPGRDLSPEENRASSHFSVKLDILWAKRDPEGYRRSCTGNHGLAELLQSLWSDHQYLVE